jgi:hypothetical protein
VTLLAFDYFHPINPDLVRANQAKALKLALESYRAAHGTYPHPFGGNSLQYLKKPLVDGGYIATIPIDPVFGETNQSRYVSIDGLTYGLLFQLQSAAGKVPAGGTCITGAGTAGTGWWGQPPDCPF